MELASMLTTQSYTILMILAVLMMILRSNKKVPNWAIQWIILVVGLGLSILQSMTFNIDVVLNAFMAAGVCLFGENAIYRKKTEKTIEESDMLDIINTYKAEKENEKHEKINMNEELKVLLKKDENK